ncbi:hypothetical protein D3C75_1003810 [compost metagenome]
MLFVQQVLSHAIKHFLSALSRAVGRRLHLRKNQTLVFIGQERGRYPGEHPDHAGDDYQVNNEARHLMPNDLAYAVLISVDAGIEPSVEPSKKTALGLAVFCRIDWLEQRGAKCRGEYQGNKYRKRHGRYDSDRELPIDHASGTTKESHR